MKSLASAILLQAVKDWEDETNRPEIREFLASEWFEELSDIAGIDPRVIRQQLESGTYNRVPLRAAYRQKWNLTEKEEKDHDRNPHHRVSARGDSRKLGDRLVRSAATD